MKSRDRRNLALVIGIAAIVVLGGVGVVLQHQLANVTRTAATELMPTRYELRPPTFPFLSFDLGYLKVALPADFDGAPHIVEPTKYVQVTSTHHDGSVAFVPPQHANDSTPNNYRVLLHQFAAATGRPMPTLFDLKRAALETEPYDLWDLPFLGIKGAKTRRGLLALKQLIVGPDGTAIHIFESPDLGAIIRRRPDSMSIDIFDRRRGTAQAVYINAASDLADQVIIAVLSSYQLTTDDFSAASIAECLRAAGATPEETQSVQSR